MYYTFSIIITSTGPSLTDMNGSSYTPSLNQTIPNNILHVGCTSVANFTGWSNQTDVSLFVNELKTDIY